MALLVRASFQEIPLSKSWMVSHPNSVVGHHLVQMATYVHLLWAAKAISIGVMPHVSSASISSHLWDIDKSPSKAVIFPPVKWSGGGHTEVESGVGAQTFWCIKFTGLGWNKDRFLENWKLPKSWNIMGNFFKNFILYNSSYSQRIKNSGKKSK